jgi:hypothetical protein
MRRKFHDLASFRVFSVPAGLELVGRRNYSGCDGEQKNRRQRVEPNPYRAAHSDVMAHQ